MVLPKEMREKANIRPGDKLALISWEKDGKVCCISMVKAEDFGDMVKGLLGPMMKEMAGTIPKPTGEIEKLIKISDKGGVRWIQRTLRTS